MGIGSPSKAPHEAIGEGGIDFEDIAFEPYLEDGGLQ